MLKTLGHIQLNFSNNVAYVYDLMNFDELVLDYAIKSIEDLTGKLKKMGIDNPRLTAESTLSSLKNIHSNNSLKPKYQTIFNQCIVLLVAYFSSTVSDIFKVALKEKLCKGVVNRDQLA